MRKGNDFRYHSRMDQAQSKLAEMQALYDVNRLELENTPLAEACCCCSPAGPPTSRRWSGG